MEKAVLASQFEPALLEPTWSDIFSIVSRAFGMPGSTTTKGVIFTTPS
jgi:hypothetical protein